MYRCLSDISLDSGRLILILRKEMAKVCGPIGQEMNLFGRRSRGYCKGVRRMVEGIGGLVFPQNSYELHS